MENWKPYIYLFRPDRGKKDCYLHITVQVPDNYFLYDITGPCYEQAPDEHYDNPANGYCSHNDQNEKYSLTRIFLKYKSFDNIESKNSVPVELKLFLEEKDFKKDEAVQVIVIKNPTDIHHDGQSVGHYGDAD